MQKHTDTVFWQELASIQPVVCLIPKSLHEQARLTHASARDTLFRIGESVRRVYLVIEGEARLVRVGRNGQEVILQRSRGGFIAEASLDSRAYHCDAVTSESTTLLSLPVAVFRKALEDNLAFRSAWQSLLAKEVRKLRAQCERLSLNSAAERISHYIESEGDDGTIMLKQSRKSWATELGLSHEALYRALRRMQDEGTLNIEGNRLSLRTKAERQGPE